MRIDLCIPILLKTEALSKASNIYYTPGHENGHSKLHAFTFKSGSKIAIAAYSHLRTVLLKYCSIQEQAY